MKSRLAVAAMVLLLVVGCRSGAAESAEGATLTATATPGVTDSAYLGQKRPGDYPLRFAPSVIRGELHTAPTFSADGTEAYWAEQGGQIMTVRLVDGKWSAPSVASSSPTMSDYRDPFIVPGGQRLYYLSDAPPPGLKQSRKENVWYAERVGDGWGEPVAVSQGVNAHQLHWLATASSAGDLYFAARDKGPGQIYCSRYLDGQHQEAEPLEETINKPEMDQMTPYIAPDGSYLIFTRMDPKNTSQIRFYISCAGADGRWSEGRLVEQVPYGLSPIVSPDGLYLFFLSSPNGVSWISTAFIERGRPAR